MSIVQKIKDFISTCPHLIELAPVHVNNVDPNIENYSVDPVPGIKIVEEYVDGGSLNEYPFTLSSRNYIIDDISRIENNGFGENFSDWLEEQTLNNTLPELGGRKTCLSVSATNWMGLYDRDNPTMGIYQIQCKLTYIQEGMI